MASFWEKGGARSEKGRLGGTYTAGEKVNESPAAAPGVPNARHRKSRNRILLRQIIAVIATSLAAANDNVVPKLVEDMCAVMRVCVPRHAAAVWMGNGMVAEEQPPHMCFICCSPPTTTTLCHTFTGVLSASRHALVCLSGGRQSPGSDAASLLIVRGVNPEYAILYCLT